MLPIYFDHNDFLSGPQPNACSKFHKNMNKLTNMHNLHKLKISMVLIILITVFVRFI